MKKLNYYLLALLFLGVTACGGGEHVSENAAESLIESMTGEEVDIDISEDGGGLTIKTEEGSMEISATNTELPEGFPPGVYLVEGERTAVSTIKSEGEVNVMFQVKTTASEIAPVADEIKENMSKWTQVMEASMGGTQRTIHFESSQVSCLYTLLKERNGTITVNYMVKYPDLSS